MKANEIDVQKYTDFLHAKMAISQQGGFDVADSELTPSLFPHVKDTVKWAVKGGSRAIFSSFGMQKTVTQLEILRLIVKHEGGKGLIVCPKRVVVEFTTQAREHLGIEIKYVRNMQEVEACDADIMVTNYERVRDGEEGVRIEPTYFTATSLDEASVLRSYATKTNQQFLTRFRGVKYRFVATATPSPNRFDELIQYSDYLGQMDQTQCIERFFQHDLTKVGNLTLYPHKEEEFWLWLSTWALFLSKPSDLGYSDDGYDLPELRVHEEVVEVDNSTAGYDRDGEGKMFRDAAIGLQDAARERRESMPQKMQRVLEIINRPENRDDHFLLWHDLEAERHELCRLIPGCKAVYGSQDEDEADRNVLDFKEGRLKYLAAKPEMLGEGLNFQHHCHKAIMFIDYRFNDKFQAIARIHRFMQKYPVDLYLVYAESEQEIYKTFMKKWDQHKKMIATMTEIVRKNGLYSLDAEKKMTRWMFANRCETTGRNFRAINNDNVMECLNFEDNSVDLIVTSIPFSSQFEYTPTYNDFGHNAGNDEFFQQMDFLTPQLMRILKPGRLACIHVKDLIVASSKTGAGIQSVVPFSDLSVLHYIKHGFVYMGRITIDTDVVRENNMSYRLGYSEMCKDGSKMGVGSPEYVLLFRKLQTDTSKGYADIPVTKVKGGEYSLAKWQIDAAGHWRSDGNRLIDNCRMSCGNDVSDITRFWSNWQETHYYNFDEHVKFAEYLEEKKLLSKTSAMMAVRGVNWNIWDDISRTRTLNARQVNAKRVKHICPLQLDIIERLIDRYSNRGELVYDPFGGIGSTAYSAVKMGRKALSTELNYDYYKDSLLYLKEAEAEQEAPTLFDFMDYEDNQSK